MCNYASVVGLSSNRTPFTAQAHVSLTPGILSSLHGHTQHTHIKAIPHHDITPPHNNDSGSGAECTVKLILKYKFTNEPVTAGWYE